MSRKNCGYKAKESSSARGIGAMNEACILIGVGMVGRPLILETAGNKDARKTTSVQKLISRFDRRS